MKTLFVCPNGHEDVFFLDIPNSSSDFTGTGIIVSPDGSVERKFVSAVGSSRLIYPLRASEEILERVTGIAADLLAKGERPQCRSCNAMAKTKVEETTP